MIGLSAAQSLDDKTLTRNRSGNVVELYPVDKTKSSPLYQKTIGASVSCSGVGVHSGSAAALTFHPAPVHTGVVFIRGDLSMREDHFIRAHVDDVHDTSFCTTLTNAHGHFARTVEHVLAALKGMDVHNVIIELHGEEVPIMDGSAAPFVRMIEQSGIVVQDQPVSTLVIHRPVCVTYGDSKAMFVPTDPGCSSSMQMTFNAGKRLNNVSWTLDFSMPDSDNVRHDFDFQNHIASARTFGFFEDAEKMWAAGLAKGTSLENTVVFQDGSVMNETGLRFHDEPVRHKLLDAVGDFALLGHRIQGNFIGVNSGHTLHYRLMKELLDQTDAFSIRTH